MSAHPDSNQRSSMFAWFQHALDEIDYGIVVCSRDRVEYVNRAARHQLAAPGPLQIRDGRPVAARPHESAALARALAAAQAGPRRQLLTLSTDDRQLQVAVVPLPPDDALGGADAAGGGLAMLVMGKRQLCPQLSRHWFCQMHGLTPAESTVLGELLQGRDPRCIAERNGVSLSTVRTQIRSIHGKTSLHGIRELLMTVAALPPVLPLLMESA